MILITTPHRLRARLILKILPQIAEPAGFFLSISRKFLNIPSPIFIEFILLFMVFA